METRSRSRKPLGAPFALLPVALLLGCSDDDEAVFAAVGAFEADIAVEWADLAYDRVRSDEISPPVAARVYGFLGVTLYQSLVGGMEGQRPRRRRSPASMAASITITATAMATRRGLPSAPA